MANITAMPFRSVDGDRPVSATMDARRFGQYVTNGIDNISGEDAFLVSVVENEFAVTVAPGGAVINGYSGWLDEEEKLIPNTPDATYPRIDRVVFRLNLSLDVRFFELLLLEGTPSETPEPPPITRDTLVYDLVLADIAIAAGSLILDASAITDRRADAELCGFTGARLSPTGDDITEEMLDPEIIEKINRAEVSANAAKRFVGDILVTKRNLSKDNTFITASGNAYLKGTYPELDTLLGTPRKAVDFSIASNAVHDAAYINGKYYICGENGLFSSVDGITWEKIAEIAGQTYSRFREIEYTNGIYVVMTYSSSLPYLISYDGKTWHTITKNTVVGENTSNFPNTTCTGLRAFNGKFYARTTTRNIYISEDGKDWTLKTLTYDNWWLMSGNGITFAFEEDQTKSPFDQKENYVTMQSGTEPFAEETRINLSTQISPYGRTCTVIFDETVNLFVAVYRHYESTKTTLRIATSADLTNWTEKKQIGSYNSDCYGILAVSDGYIVVFRQDEDSTTEGAYIAQLYSRDFKTVTTLPSPTTVLAESTDSAWATDGEEFILADTAGTNGVGYTTKKYMTVPKLTHSNYNTYIKARSDA